MRTRRLLKATITAVAAAALGVMAVSAQAATEAQKRAAIDSGLAYLATTQNAAGYFGGGGTDYLIANTGSALLAFMEEKANWDDGTDPVKAAAYQAAVDKGLNYLMSQASVVPFIAATAAGNPDKDGNGVGVKLYPGGTDNRDTYVTGIALPAIASSGTPDKLVTVGPLAGRTDGSGAGGAWTYKDVVQNAIDYFAYGQTDAGAYRGGWRYYANYGNSDQSTSQWPVIAALFAQKMGVDLPAFVKAELNVWTNYIQNPTNGSAGYTGPFSPEGEMNETGALLVMQAYLGRPVSDTTVQKALEYINAHWRETANNTWDGNFNHPYAMWAIYKGLESTIGLDANTSVLSNLRPGNCGDDVDNPNHSCNWWEDYNDYLVDNQATNGSWAGYSYWNPGLATPWFINILAGTKISNDDGGDIPEPVTIGLVGLGLLGMAALRRRRPA
jgi:hypothetical protein